MDRYLQKFRQRLLCPPPGGVTYAPDEAFGWYAPAERYSGEVHRFRSKGGREDLSWDLSKGLSWDLSWAQGPGQVLRLDLSWDQS